VTADEWQRVRDVFEAALERAPADRAAFVSESCAGAEAVRAEVTSLLRAHQRAGDFMEAPAAEAAADPVADPSGESLEGKTVGHYLVRQEIGRGGMGIVYLAEDLQLSRRVAMKVLPPALGRERAWRERLRQEARAAATLSHPGIATVHALESIDEGLYLVSEYVTGPTLRALLDRGPIGPQDAIEIAAQLARALAAAHAHGVVHRDLKPENVIRTPSGTVKILDFGLARDERGGQERLTRIGTLMGTPAYMSPEQARGQDADFRTDLFSWGTLVYEMASGSNPFASSSAVSTLGRVAEFEPPPLSSVARSWPAGLDAIVGRCLRKSPAERYPTTQALVADVEQLQSAAAADRLSGSGTPAVGPAVRGAASGSRVWWQVHQAVIAAVYAATLYPAWLIRSWLPQPWGAWFLIGLLACAAGAIGLRLHLWFAARCYPGDLPAIQRKRAGPWIRGFDLGFAGCLLAVALAIGVGHGAMAAAMAGVSVLVLIASLLIEPATAAAAFAQDPRGRRPEAPDR
jgi:eukaryotic-like serine/threonine-protein kinase